MTDRITLGVFLKGRPDRERPFGGMTPFFLRLCRLGATLGVRVVGLYPGGLRAYDQQRLPVIVWGGERRGFQVREVRLPDLIWERVKRKPGTGEARALRDLGVPLLNSVVLNKWEAYRLLLQDPEIRPYLPETHLLNESEAALDLLERYGRAYVKPVSGAMGRGILRLLRQGRRYRGEYAPGPRRSVRSVLLRGRELEEWLEDRTDDETYLVQQGLELEVVGGRIADIRVLVQKDGSGRWAVTGMGARLGAPGRFTANLHTGGRGLPLRWLLARLMPREPARQREIEELARSLALRVCHALEARTGPLGELGIDLGLEPSGRLWYIEHNYYPGRSILQHMGDRRGYELAHRRPLEYARWAVARIRRGEPLVLPPEAQPGGPAPAAPAAHGAHAPAVPAGHGGTAPPVPAAPGTIALPASTASGAAAPETALASGNLGRLQRHPPESRRRRPVRSGSGRLRGLEPAFLRSAAGVVWRPVGRQGGRLRTAGR